MSGEDAVNDFSTYVRQAFLATLMEIGQGLVIETHHMQDGCMDVVEVDAILDRFEAKFIGRPVTHTTLDTRSRKPHGKSIGIVVSPRRVLAFAERHSTEFASPDNQG